jgi:short-subunit dehydrogenase
MELQDKVVIVTGAGTGIGAALSRAMWKAGAKVVLAGRRFDKLREVAQDAPPHAALCVATDVARLDDLQTVRNEALARFGVIDVVVNNAGIAYGPHLEAQTFEEIEREIAVNLTAPIKMTRLCLADLKQRPRGLIVNIASMSALVGLPFQSVYAASKHGLRGFGAALRRELLDSNVHVMTVYPTTVETDVFDANMLESIAKLDFPVMSAADVAQQIASGMVREATDLVVCAPRERILPFIDRWFPGTIDRMARSKSKELAEIVSGIAAHSRRRDAEQALS